MRLTRRAMAAVIAIVPGFGAARARAASLGVGNCGVPCPADVGWGCNEWGEAFPGPNPTPRCTRRQRRKNRERFDYYCAGVRKANCANLCLAAKDAHRCG